MFDKYIHIAKKEVKKEKIDNMDKTISYVEKVLDKMSDIDVLRVYKSTQKRNICKPSKSCEDLLIILKQIMTKRGIKYE